MARPTAGTRQIFPSECRERRITYAADLQLTLHVQVGDQNLPWVITRTVGQVPIMVKSERCYLHGATPAEMIQRHEEAEEMGGYFIVNGNEKVIRMILVYFNQPLRVDSNPNHSPTPPHSRHTPCIFFHSQNPTIITPHLHIVTESTPLSQAH